MLVPLLGPSGHLPAIFTHVFSPLLTVTQSLALMEVLHSLQGIVRAPVFTTFLQVVSRVMVVWGVMFMFHEGSRFVQPGEGIVGGDYAGVLEGKGTFTGAGPGAKLGDYAFLGCLTAWGITECIRYGFFALQSWGRPVPRWWTWLR
jgi:very-long-chain (3R)-3-hydroxyacyl-CoA dehydratase